MDTILGIDLGTTNCSVTAIDADGKTMVVKNSLGEYITPSAVYFCEKKNEFLVGKKAKEKSNSDPENLVVFVKREMGKDKTKVREDKIDGTFSPYKFWNKIWSAEEISAVILKQLKQDAEKTLGKEIKKAVVTCPAYFGDAEKNATEIAGKLAGLEVLEILAEPTAAAYSYCAVSKKEEEIVLVFDLGGGTFDVTILKIATGKNGRIVEPIATDGNHKLGGKDWDDAIISYMIDRFDKKYNIDIDFEPRAQKELVYGRLRIDVEKAKVALFKEGVESVPITIEYGGKSHTENISRALYAQKTQKLTDQCRIYCNNILAGKGLSWNDIDTILMIGNMSNCATVQDALKTWSGKDINFGFINPKTCVSEGAAIRGFLLEGGDTVKVLGAGQNADFASFEQEKSSVEKAEQIQNNSERVEQTFDSESSKSGVLPFSVGIKVISNKTGKNVIFKFFKKNDSYPCTFTHAFPPARDGDETLTLEVYEGEGETPDSCNLLGTVNVNLGGNLTRQDKLEITLAKDSSGILRIEAKNQKTGIYMKAEINRENAISDSDLENKAKAFEEFSLG